MSGTWIGSRSKWRQVTALQAFLAYYESEEGDNVAILEVGVELEADYRSYGSPAIAHKRAKHPALKPIDQINLRLVHHELYCAT